MTDLNAVLPDFPAEKYARLLPSLEKRRVTTADLLILDSLEIAKRARLPALDVKELCNDVLEALQGSLGVKDSNNKPVGPVQLQKTGEQVVNGWNTISLLDPEFDRALKGGIPTGSITEVTGESGAGKTQFLLTLLLSAQLPPPQGLSCSTLYLSTESALPVVRVNQILQSHPEFYSADHNPSLERIFSIVTSDLESQDHIIYFQVPVAIRRYGIRLLIIDSVAANYRVELDGDQRSGKKMGQRSSGLVKLGHFLRNMAQGMDIAIVVANQVADRISDNSPRGRSPMSGAAASQSHLPPRRDETSLGCMHLDHQQRWFTGWGDDSHASELLSMNLKTPSLGLVWTTQIACRIALIKKANFAPDTHSDGNSKRGELKIKRLRRWLKVVFASHAPESGRGIEDAVEFEIRTEGLKALRKTRMEAAESLGRIQSIIQEK